MIDSRLPPYLSYTSISTYIKCPELFYRRYILGEKEEGVIPFVIGKAFHRSMEQNFTHKIAHGVDLSNRSVEIIFNEAFDESAAEDGFNVKDLEDEKRVAWRLVEQYHREMAPFITPLAVEKKLEMDLPGTKIKKLIGYVDLITDKNVVVDYKAAAWPWADALVTQSLQPTVYGLLLNKGTLHFEYHMIIKSDSIRKEKFGDGLVIKSTVRREKDYEWLRSLITKMIRLVENEDLYDYIIPNPGQQCLTCPSRKTCGYRTR